MSGLTIECMREEIGFDAPDGNPDQKQTGDGPGPSPAEVARGGSPGLERYSPLH